MTIYGDVSAAESMLDSKLIFYMWIVHINTVYAGAYYDTGDTSYPLPYDSHTMPVY